jgi:hypothetical protein
MHYGLLTDVSSGRVYDFPRGGDDNLYMQLHFTANSSLIVLRWYGPAKEGAKPALLRRDAGLAQRALRCSRQERCRRRGSMPEGVAAEIDLLQL